ncbi:MAG: MlaC/ttg2D family ABC transporter substrate-binding protein [Gammaproteobacteria bacterium]
MQNRPNHPPFRKPRRLRFAGALALVVLAAPAFAATPKPATSKPATQAPGPAAVIKDTSSHILSALDANRAKLKHDPALANKLVRKYLLPNLAFDMTSQAVLGRYWRAATPAQRKAFQQAFLHYLITTYSKGIQHYHGAKVKVLPFRGDKSQKYVRVRSQIIVPDHSPIEVDYALVHTDSGWKVFDVIIAGVSYVKTYQSEFQAEVRRTSLAALIKRLQHTQAPKTLTAMKARAPGTGG